MGEKRRTFAICVSGYNKDCEFKVIQGISEECKKNNSNLLVFSSPMLKEDLVSAANNEYDIIRGEMEIFNLVNYDLIDGLFIFGETIPTLEAFDKIIQNCKENNVPVVNIGDIHHKSENSIYIENKASMEIVVEHLVNHHKFTKINYIGGIPDNKESEERLAAYKKVLTDHNIPIEEKRIGYGYFWRQSVECAKEFLKDSELPQAIVCANDTMAIMVMDYLKNCGYSIPDDIVVTGFDGTPDADEYEPSITTLRPDYFDAGKKAFNMMENVIAGITGKDYFISSKLCIQQSCGCHSAKTKNKLVVHDYLEKNYGNRHNFMQFAYNIVTMNLMFSKADNSYVLFDALLNGGLSLDFNRIYMCICSELEREKEFFYDETQLNKKYGISTHMVSVVRYGHNVPVGTIFPSKKLLPFDVLNEENPCVMYFSPMYFKDRFLGYVAYEPRTSDFLQNLFLVWLQIASNDIGSFYIKNELENMYIRDPLTSLYNRRGMKKLFQKLCTEAQQKKKGYLVMYCADIDFLKSINDVYGHEAGDNAIVRVADALRLGLPKNTICARTGGDEFCMLTYVEEDKNIYDYVNECIQDVKDNLANYNEKSNMPYRVQCSCGYYIESAELNLDIKEMCRKADNALYKVKENRTIDKNYIVHKFED